MIVIDGYSIEEFPKENKICISLPQTMSTVINSTGIIMDRKEKLTDIELAIILLTTRKMFNKRNGEEK